MTSPSDGPALLQARHLPLGHIRFRADRDDQLDLTVTLSDIVELTGYLPDLGVLLVGPAGQRAQPLHGRGRFPLPRARSQRAQRHPRSTAAPHCFQRLDLPDDTVRSRSSRPTSASRFPERASNDTFPSPAPQLLERRRQRVGDAGLDFRWDQPERDVEACTSPRTQRVMAAGRSRKGGWSLSITTAATLAATSTSSLVEPRTLRSLRPPTTRSPLPPVSPAQAPR